MQRGKERKRDRGYLLTPVQYYQTTLCSICSSSSQLKDNIKFQAVSLYSKNKVRQNAHADFVRICASTHRHLYSSTPSPVHE